MKISDIKNKDSEGEYRVFLSGRDSLRYEQNGDTIIIASSVTYFDSFDSYRFTNFE